MIAYVRYVYGKAVSLLRYQLRTFVIGSMHYEYYGHPIQPPGATTILVVA
jgi:hypothetical protein